MTKTAILNVALTTKSGLVHNGSMHTSVNIEYGDQGNIDIERLKGFVVSNFVRDFFTEKLSTILLINDTQVTTFNKDCVESCKVLEVTIDD